MNWNGKNFDRILITGGAGFIGSNFVQLALNETGAKIVNLDLLTYAGNSDSLASVSDSDRYNFVHGDIGDKALVEKLLIDFRPNCIINFAAESHVDRSIDGPAAFVQTNVVGTFNLLECARQFWLKRDSSSENQFKILHVSTDEVYGSLGNSGRFDEGTPYAPNSPYSASKAASDHFVRAWHSTYGMPTVITNCSNNYGPYQFPEKLVPLITLNAIEGKPLPIYGDGGNVRDWLYVEDHCRALLKVLEEGRPGEVYNIGGDSERTNLEVVNEITELLDELLPDSPSRPHGQLKEFVEDRPGHDRRYAVDASKIKRELGWEPRESFSTGLRRTVQWYIGNAQWCDRIHSGAYRRKRLGTLDK